MIIYGTKAVHLKSEESKTTTCSNCNTRGSLIINLFRKHFHIFWIPIFPIGKKGYSECQNCKTILPAKQMSGEIKKEYSYLKEMTKGPIWQFSGLGLIALLIIWISSINKENNRLELEYLNSPISGDVYEYKIESRSYSTLKVISVTDDSVWVSPNEYEINKMSRLYKIDKPENYPNFSYGISRIQLKKMYESNEIFDINR